MKLQAFFVSFLLFSTLLTSCASGPKHYETSGEEVTYKAAGVPLKGYIARPKGDGPFPGVLVVHEWWGHNAYARKRADMLAENGYVALAVDMYGNGKQAGHPKDAMKFSSAVFKNMDLSKKKFNAALDLLKSDKKVNAEKTGAIGYCFGGGVVLTMVRFGADLDAVASFHGSLKSPVKAKKGLFSGKVEIFNGAADPMVSADDITQIKKEFKSAGIPVDVTNYEGAKHAFTNKEADMFGEKFNLPLAYNKHADEDSWSKLLVFFDETLKK